MAPAVAAFSEGAFTDLLALVTLEATASMGCEVSNPVERDNEGGAADRRTGLEAVPLLAFGEDVGVDRGGDRAALGLLRDEGPARGGLHGRRLTRAVTPDSERRDEEVASTRLCRCGEAQASL